MDTAPTALSRSDRKALIDAVVQALIRVHGCSNAFVFMVQFVGKHAESRGLARIRPEDWPGSEALLQHEDIRTKILDAARRDDPTCVMAPRFWPSVITDVQTTYEEWRASIAAAIDVVNAAKDEIDDPHSPPLMRTSAVLVAKLVALEGCFHWMRYGKDGLGVIRCGLVQIPDAADSLCRELLELRTILEHTEPRARHDHPDGWSMSDLCTQGEVGVTTLREMMTKARVKRPARGEHEFRFSPRDVQRVVDVGLRSSGKRKWRSAAERLRSLLSTGV